MLRRRVRELGVSCWDLGVNCGRGGPQGAALKGAAARGILTNLP